MRSCHPCSCPASEPVCHASELPLMHDRGLVMRFARKRALSPRVHRGTALSLPSSTLKSTKAAPSPDGRRGVVHRAWSGDPPVPVEDESRPAGSPIRGHVVRRLAARSPVARRIRAPRLTTAFAGLAPFRARIEATQSPSQDPLLRAGTSRPGFYARAPSGGPVRPISFRRCRARAPATLAPNLWLTLPSFLLCPLNDAFSASPPSSTVPSHRPIPRFSLWCVVLFSAKGTQPLLADPISISHCSAPSLARHALLVVRTALQGPLC
jgi:hypothetical protein